VRIGGQLFTLSSNVSYHKDVDVMIKINVKLNESHITIKTKL